MTNVTTRWRQSSLAIDGINWNIPMWLTQISHFSFKKGLTGSGNFFTWNTKVNTMGSLEHRSLLEELWLLYKIILAPFAPPRTFYVLALIGWSKLPARPDWSKESERLCLLPPPNLGWSVPNSPRTPFGVQISQVLKQRVSRCIRSVSASGLSRTHLSD